MASRSPIKSSFLVSVSPAASPTKMYPKSTKPRPKSLSTQMVLSRAALEEIRLKKELKENLIEVSLGLSPSSKPSAPKRSLPARSTQGLTDEPADLKSLEDPEPVGAAEIQSPSVAASAPFHPISSPSTKGLVQGRIAKGPRPLSPQKTFSTSPARSSDPFPQQVLPPSPLRKALMSSVKPKVPGPTAGTRAPAPKPASTTSTTSAPRVATEMGKPCPQTIVPTPTKAPAPRVVTEMGKPAGLAPAVKPAATPAFRPTPTKATPTKTLRQETLGCPSPQATKRKVMEGAAPVSPNKIPRLASSTKRQEVAPSVVPKEPEIKVAEAQPLFTLPVPQSSQRTPFKLAKEDTETLYNSPISKQRSQLRQTVAILLQRDVAMWLGTLVPGFEPLDSFQEQLVTGVVLCRVLLTIDPSLQLRVFSRAQKGTYFARDNVAMFINAWKKMFTHSEGFEVNDLIEGKNMEAVVNCLLELGRLAAKRGMVMPRSIALEREIDEEAIMPESEVVELKGPAPIASPQVEHDDIDDHMDRVLAENEKLRDRFVKISRGKYWLLRDELPPKQTYVRVLLDHVMVRVGGGWQDLEQYCEKHV